MLPQVGFMQGDQGQPVGGEHQTIDQPGKTQQHGGWTDDA